VRFGQDDSAYDNWLDFSRPSVYGLTQRIKRDPASGLNMKALDQISLKTNDRRAIEKAVRVLQSQFPVERVVLYGSKATGTDDAESDIDLLVLTTRDLDWRERSRIVDALFDVQLELGVVISPLVISSREWSRGRYTVLPIHDEIERYGVAA